MFLRIFSHCIILEFSTINFYSYLRVLLFYYKLNLEKLNYFFYVKSVLVKSSETSIIDELEKIKKLLILQLSKSNASVNDIANAAGMSKRDLYKIIPKKRAKKRKKKK